MLQRKPTRLHGFNYANNGYYFVTICVKNRKAYFGNVVDRQMILNQLGEIIESSWLDLINHYNNCLLDEYIIMPNHMHGIVVINNQCVGEGFKPSPTDRKIYSLFEIIRGFKTFSSRRMHELYTKEFQWQRSFYDHIIRNETSLNSIRNYIRYNPYKWDIDEYNT
jgi:REP element-mobilizing transposase RayT